MKIFIALSGVLFLWTFYMSLFKAASREDRYLEEAFDRYIEERSKRE